MLESLNRNFGLLIAFVLPGFSFLVGLALLENSDVLKWPEELSRFDQVDGFVFLLLASTAVGMVLSAIRWVVLDNFHHATGIDAPRLDFRKLELKQSAFMLVVENNYRYYLFYGNTLMGLLLVGVAAVSDKVEWTAMSAIRWAALCAILFLASRDSLSRFYNRSRLIMGELPAFSQRARK